MSRGSIFFFQVYPQNKNSSRRVARLAMTNKIIEGKFPSRDPFPNPNIEGDVYYNTCSSGYCLVCR